MRHEVLEVVSKQWLVARNCHSGAKVTEPAEVNGVEESSAVSSWSEAIGSIAENGRIYYESELGI